jgi:hypothetical protein
MRLHVTKRRRARFFERYVRNRKEKSKKPK